MKHIKKVIIFLLIMCMLTGCGIKTDKLKIDGILNSVSSILESNKSNSNQEIDLTGNISCYLLSYGTEALKNHNINIETLEDFYKNGVIPDTGCYFSILIEYENPKLRNYYFRPVINVAGISRPYQNMGSNFYDFGNSNYSLYTIYLAGEYEPESLSVYLQPRNKELDSIRFNLSKRNSDGSLEVINQNIEADDTEEPTEDDKTTEYFLLPLGFELLTKKLHESDLPEIYKEMIIEIGDTWYSKEFNTFSTGCTDKTVTYNWEFIFNPLEGNFSKALDASNIRLEYNGEELENIRYYLSIENGDKYALFNKGTNIVNISIEYSFTADSMSYETEKYNNAIINVYKGLEIIYTDNNGNITTKNFVST